VNLKENLEVISRLFLGGIFAFAGFSKVFYFRTFVYDFQNFEIIPSSIVLPFAFLLVALEASFGVTLTVGLFSRISALVLAVLSAIFALATFINLIRGNIVHCGCFGSIDSEAITYNNIIRNLVLFAIGVWTALQRHFKFSLDAILARNENINQ